LPELPVVSGAELVVVLERLGFHVARQRGSHVMLRKGANACVVPLHRELKRGTLRGVLRQANIDIEVFLSALD
jgi:predicted RNA binding protein YcfA (HicA-like mRNA interferase family)